MKPLFRSVWIFLLGLTPHVAAGDELAYRLAGIVDVSDSHRIAMIESSDGSQDLYRVNGELGAARIVAIEPASVVLEHSGKRLRLSLRQRPRSLSDLEVMAVPEEGARVQQREVSYDNTAGLLQTLTPDAGLEDEADSTQRKTGFRGPGSDADVDRADRARINRVLGLPPGARVIGVGSRAVFNARELIDTLLPALAAGTAVHLTLEDAGDLDELVLMPRD